MKQVALVSTTLLATLRDFVKRFIAETMEFDLQDSTTPAQVAAKIQDVATKGSVIRDFRVRMGPVHDFFYFEAPMPSDLEQLEIDWTTVFGCMSSLRRLDLARVPLSSRHFENILEAAATKCPHVEFLSLPCEGDITHSENLMALCSAMKTWCVRGRRGGLKQLTLPSCPKQEHMPFRNSKCLFDALAQYCPGIKFVVKHHLINFFEADYYDDKWAISLETWRKFNASCTALTQFHWQVVPFADSFFRLKTLTIWSNPTWEYKRHMRELDGSNVNGARSCPGYGVLATDVAAVMKACPALTLLSIEIHHLGDYRTEARIWVSTCPDHDDTHIIFVKTLTDRALAHLGQLPYLAVCALPPGRVTGRGIFEYIRSVSKTEDAIGKKRSISIGIGGINRREGKIPFFYFELVELLKLLAETDEEALGAAFCRPKPKVVVDHPYEFYPGRAWLDTYTQNELEPLLKIVQEKHPSLKLDVDTGGTIDRIKLCW
ncbi:hypothetical protein PHYSODRAFT_317045 [Phytophthora sojae]|uniref:Uncharacterized protein n=1 Tax=Phytophthora sojae (strain P6497) TaxID=1094619 RepID=G4ZR58_PHYSP|nr:hypothetical protein PHYSODRAFT_317045 [Phytophthora sojae]EGZ14280.1 hypothetical protein PHYSODRAFT_317045 [Phytophthora sojae]|eukprot:XP_009531709.1 hypothetical protein PHYSODRAFT_317045 [Phytophthora sojae]